MNIHTFRLKPGQDLWNEIEQFAKTNNIQAATILCAVGSFTHAILRLANRATYNEYEGHFEIVSITGTVSVHGSHIHVSISDGDGRTLGGHLVPGCKIYTTAEVVLLEAPGVAYLREPCDQSGYDELVVRRLE